MTPREQRELELERWADETLRQLPPRRAPRDLTSRVLAEIERRAALPWWRKEFSAWPFAAKLALFAVLAVSVKAGLMLTDWLVGNVDAATSLTAVSSELSWIESVMAAFAALIRGIPDLWIQGVLALLAVLYGTLFGLGTAVYRTLYARR